MSEIHDIFSSSGKGYTPLKKIEGFDLPKSSGGPAAPGTAVGVPAEMLGKLMSGANIGSVGLPAGVAGMIGAGMGWIASGVLGNNQKESVPVALGVGLLLTPINIPIKFIENFGKALIPNGSKEPEIYKKLDDSYKTNVLPFCKAVGKKAVQEQKEKDFDLDSEMKRELSDDEVKERLNAAIEEIRADKPMPHGDNKIPQKDD